MSIEKIGKRSNTLKGPYKPPRFRATGLIDGVFFSRVYRSEKGARRLEKDRSITALIIDPLQ